MRLYSEDILIEFGLEKCAILIMKSGKRKMTEGIELLNEEKIRTLREKETYKYFGIIEMDTIKHAEMKEIFFKKDDLRITGKLLKKTT